MWEFWCEDFSIAAELWAKRRINLSWKMSQQLISLKFPPFSNTNTTREHASREKLILSAFAHVLRVHPAAIYKRIEQGKKKGTLLRFATDVNDGWFIRIYSRTWFGAGVQKLWRLENLMSWTDPDQKHGRSLVQIYSQDTEFVAIFSGIWRLLFWFILCVQRSL